MPNTLEISTKNKERFINEAIAIDTIDAIEAGALGFTARALVQATMPHTRVAGNEFTRKNGDYTLTMLAPSDVGLPYGIIPRLLMAWLSTEAVKTKSREIVLGNSLSEFMKELNLIPTGGRWGNITSLRTQMARLFSASISCTYDNGKHWAIKNVQLVSGADLWWSPKQPNQATLWDSTLTLGQELYNEITNAPVPIDLRVLKTIKRSSLAIDIYCWLTYRMSYLKRIQRIRWPTLQAQFGCDYSKDSQGVRDFKKAFIRELKKVYTVYSNLLVDCDAKFLILHPSKTHIQPIKNQER